MPLAVAAESAKAWSSWLRLARLQTGFAATQGRVSAALREPETVTRVAQLILQEIAELPAAGQVTLSAPDDPDFLVFAHYQRASTVWLDELAGRGVISAQRGDGARRFERALLDYAGLATADALAEPPPVPPAAAARPGQPGAHRGHAPRLVLDLSWPATEPANGTVSR